MYPECEEIMRLAPDYHIIPVCKEIYADVITPITLLRKIAAVSKKILSVGKCRGRRKRAAFSDGAIVGSAIVRIVAEHGADCVAYVKEYVQKMKAAVVEA